MSRSRLPRGLGGGCRARVLELLASSPPQSVASMARALRLSYMGVKSQCAKLERSGYLATSLQHRQRGRPELHYRITPKGRSLFPHGGGSDLALSLLEHAAKLCGAQIPGKMLFSYFSERAGQYASAIRGTTPEERAAELAALRTSEGCFSRFENGRLIEGNSPLQRLFEKYPEARAFETSALAKAVGCELVRSEGSSGESLFLLASTREQHPQSEVAPPTAAKPPQATVSIPVPMSASLPVAPPSPAPEDRESPATPRRRGKKASSETPIRDDEPFRLVAE